MADLKGDICTRLLSASGHMEKARDKALMRESATTIERLREICGEYWRTLCHYDHDDISANWNQYADGAPIPPKDERYAQMCRELDEAKQDLVEAQCDGERLRGLLGEALPKLKWHETKMRERGYDALPEVDLIARIDAELAGEGEDDHG